MRIKPETEREKGEVFGREASSNGKTQGSNRCQQHYFKQNQYVAHRKDDQNR